MAAAEYFSNTPIQQSPPYQPYHYPSPQQSYSQPHYSPQQQNSQMAPPPYDQKPGVHFAPPPTEMQQRHSFSGQQRPSMSSQNSALYQQNPYASASNLNVQRYGQHSGYGSPKPQHLSPHVRPYTNPNASQYSLGGYSSDPEPRRRRHRRREDGESRTRRDSGESREIKTKTSRSKNADSFLGAAGGGLIGDLIFPGLGTIGGAAIGWLGGKDYANHRKSREEKRHKEQRKWEEKYESGRHHRGGSHDRRSRANSSDIGEIDPRDYYSRKSSHY